MTQTAPAMHYKYAPSASKRWLACPASAGAEDDDSTVPEEWRIKAEWGHVAHETAAFALQTGVPIFGDDWVARMVRPYLAFVGEQKGSRYHELQLESLTVAGHGGTVDTLILNGSHGHIVDLKTGKNRVPAEESTQLLCYAGLVREHFPALETFTCTIVQPQVWKRPKSVEYTADQVDSFRGRVVAASHSQAVVPGDHCGFCPLRRECGPGLEYNKERGWPY